MLKALLINMPIRTGAAPNVVPTGVGIIAAALEAHGVPCDVLDLNRFRPANTVEQVRKMITANQEHYDLIGMSGMITTLKWQKQIAGIVKNRWPDSLLLSGGGLASDFGKDLQKWIPELDVAVVGEGEPHIERIVSRMRSGITIDKVLGPEVVQDIDTVPKVAWSKFDMETYLGNDIWGKDAQNSSWTAFEMTRSINLISSRGCPYNCNFCDRHATGGRNYRLAGCRRIIENITEVIDRYHVDFVGFLDDNFLSDRRRLETLLPMLKETGVAWGCHGRLNDIRDGIAEKLREAGCLYIGFGAESADELILKRMNKKNSPEQMSRAVRSCQEVGITPNCTWIMGYPGETRESLRTTAAFILEHGLSQKSMFVATAYPGTRLFKEVEDKVLNIFDSLEEYVMELDDATKVLVSARGVLNYSDMPDDEFLQCRDYVERGTLDLI